MIALFRMRDVLPSVVLTGSYALAALLGVGWLPADAQTVPPAQAEQSEPTAQAAQATQPAQVVMQLKRDKGVLFKITPPPPVLLPADATAQVPPAAPADSATTATAAASATAVRPSYLLGTIHFGSPEEQGVDYAVLEKRLAEVENFVNEADVNSAWKPEFDTYRWMPVQTPLEGMIGKDDIQKAQALLPSVRLQDLQRMKPWAVLALLEARGESAGATSMDARMQTMATAAGKHLVHLETLEQQLQALDCVPAAEHAAVLDERLRKSWILRIESAEAMAYYRSRNLDAWLASIDRMDGLSDSARAIEQRSRLCLLEDRNARWIGPLETVFQDGPSLVAVGAIHLMGSDGLIARLRRDGYTVEAVPF
jgi:hypothetical protein